MAGIIAAVVSVASSFAVLLSGLRGVGATPEQANSGMVSICMLVGGLTVLVALRTRLPITFAWSTPGAALLATSGHHAGWPAAVGAFIVSGLLLALTGIWPLLGRLINSIPSAIASAMLAGVLITICVVPARFAAQSPAEAAPVILIWLLLSRVARRWATTGALVAAGAVVALAPAHAKVSPSLLPHLAATLPRFDLGTIIAIGLPLFLVTMTAQNIVGVGVLRTFGYRPRVGPLLSSSGAASMIGAPFGTHAINLAAIGAALTAGPSGGTDVHQRWIAAASAGATKVILGLGAGLVVAFAAIAPPLLIETVAGLALLGSLAAALSTALGDQSTQEAATVALVVTVAGISPLGVSAPAWGLAAGLAVHGLVRPRRRLTPHG